MLPQIPDSRPDPDEYHAKMDDDVRVMIGPMRFGWKLDENVKSLTDQQSGDLLWLIISGALDTTNLHSEWNTPQGSTNRLSLFKKALVVAGPALKEAFVSALQENSFKYIRNAAFLRQPFIDPAVRPVEDEHTPAARAVRGAWEREYVTSTAEHFCNMLEKMKQNKNIDYGNTVAIVQSSGTGKSRMVDEAARFIFTLPFNLRDDTASHFMSYPSPDPSVRNYLLSQDMTDISVRTCYHAFLMVLFNSAEKELSTLYGDGKLEKDKLADLWRDHLKTGHFRDEFYRHVVLISTEEYEKTKSAVNQEGALTDMTSKAIQACRKLHGTLRDKASNLQGNVDIFIYFDEAHVLTERNPFDRAKSYTLYKVLRSVLNEFLELPMFVVFLSTTSHVGAFAPPLGLKDSARTLASGAHQAPITETPFDCAPNILVKPDTHTLEDVADVRFMARFGRPLFWTWMEQIAGVDGNRSIDTFIGTLRGKLLSDKDISKPMAEYTALGRLAVLDVRLNLEYEPLVEGNRSLNSQAQLIKSHMRIAYSIPAHREYFRSGYPSEPILAEAASRQLHLWRTERQTAFFDILSEHMKNGLLDRGERGEAVARMLVTEAYDRAVIEEGKAEGKAHFSDGCTVVGWIQQFFQQEVATAILDSTPANCAGQRLEDVFKDARLRFTHFAKAADDHIINTHSMFAAFARGMAFTCGNGQSAIDFILPVLLMNAKLSPWVMTAIFVQVKRRKRAGDYKIDAEALKFFHKEGPDKLAKDTRPYITLIMDLGVQPNLPAYATLAAQDVIKRHKNKANLPQVAPTFTPTRPLSPSKITVSHTPPPSSYSQRRGPQPEAPVKGHPRYEVGVKGCSNTLFKVIEDADRQRYQELLRINEFLYEHPRPETIPQVMNLKPMFALGKNSYDWVESNVLNVEGVSPSELGVNERRFWVGAYEERNT